MNMQKLLWIVNPHAGRGQIRERMMDILDIFIKSGYQVEVYITQEPGDATRKVVERGAAMDRIICSGGDGTLDETVNGLMQIPEEERPSLGYISAGTTNDFAHSLNIPGDMIDAAMIASEGYGQLIDIGVVNDSQYFCYVYGFGAFTDISYITPQNLKKVLGHQAYILEGARQILNLKPTFMKVEANGQVWEGEFLCGLVSNSKQIGGLPGLWGNDISMKDGLLEITLLKQPDEVLGWGDLAASFITGQEHSEYKIQFKTDYVRFEAKEPLKWVKDGEFGGEHEVVELRCMPHAIRFASNPIGQ